MRIVTFKVDEDLLYLLDRYARSIGVSRSDVIREAIREYLERRGVKVVLRPKLTCYFLLNFGQGQQFS